MADDFVLERSDTHIFYSILHLKISSNSSTHTLAAELHESNTPAGFRPIKTMQPRNSSMRIQNTRETNTPLETRMEPYQTFNHPLS